MRFLTFLSLAKVINFLRLESLIPTWKTVFPSRKMSSEIEKCCQKWKNIALRPQKSEKSPPEMEKSPIFSKKPSFWRSHLLGNQGDPEMGSWEGLRGGKIGVFWFPEVKNRGFLPISRKNAIFGGPIYWEIKGILKWGPERASEVGK